MRVETHSHCRGGEVIATHNILHSPCFMKLEVENPVAPPPPFSVYKPFLFNSSPPQKIIKVVLVSVMAN